MTSNRFGDLIREARAARSLRQVDVVRLLGHTNLNKGVRNLALLEEHGQGRQDFLDKVIRALDLDRAALKAAYEQDQQEESEAYERWLDEPVVPTLSTFCLVGIGVSIPEEFRVPIPGDVPEHSALEAYAIEKAREFGAKVANPRPFLLQLNRRWRIWVSVRPGGPIIRRERASWTKPPERLGAFLKNGQGFGFGA